MKLFSLVIMQNKMPKIVILQVNTKHSSSSVTRVLIAHTRTYLLGTINALTFHYLINETIVTPEFLVIGKVLLAYDNDVHVPSLFARRRNISFKETKS